MRERLFRTLFLIKQKVLANWLYFLIGGLVIFPLIVRRGYLFFTDQVWGPVIKIDLSSPSLLLDILKKLLSFVFAMAFWEKIYIGVILLVILFSGKELVFFFLSFVEGVSVWKGSLFVCVLGLFLLFNPFVYDRALYGQFGILAAYGFLLLTGGYLIKAWHTLNPKNLIVATVFASLCLMFAMNFVFFIAILYLLFLGMMFFRKGEVKNRKLWLKFLGASILSILLFFLININWLIPFVLGNSTAGSLIKGGITEQDLMAFQTAGATPIQTFKNVILMSGFWGKDQFRYFDLTNAPGWERSFIFLLPIILYGVWLSFYQRSRNEKIFSASLLFVYVMAVLLAVGIKAPIAREISMLLYNHLPFYLGLREPQKWVVVIIPIYLFYLTIGAVALSKKKIIASNKVLSGIILAGIIVMQAPGLLWGFGGQVKPTNYPADWYEVDSLILAKSERPKDCQDKIIFLPWHMYMSFGWIGRVVANPAPHFFSCPVISGTNMEWGGIYDNSQNTDGQSVNNWLDKQGKAGIPSISGKLPRYVILAKEIDWQKYAWLNDLANLAKVKETKTLILYEFKY